MKNLTDEELLNLYRQGNEDALDFLLGKYKSLAVKISRSYFLIGAETEDLLQEAMIGLYSACRNFKADAGASFMSFATLCITRAVQSAVKLANRQKHKFLNESLSLSAEGDEVLAEKGSANATFFVPSSAPDPEKTLIEHEKLDFLKKLINENLSLKEKKVLSLYLQGLSYAQIASTLGENVKSVDNAISRTKRKLEELV